MCPEYFHKSVMTKELVAFFQNSQASVIADLTAGGGGHLSELLRALPESCKIIACDRDSRAHALDAAGGIAAKNPSRVTLVQQPFSQIFSILSKLNIPTINGLVCDLGVSSYQFDNPERGFSLKLDGPIDMRMDQNSGISAYQWLKQNDEKTIADTLYLYGGERKSRAIASLIKKSWPIENSTLNLARLITRAIRNPKWQRIHPATRSFQALRIAINNEMQELESLLDQLPSILAPNATAVFISFHSLEDRIIKNKFKSFLAKDFTILTKKPATPSEQEQSSNPRSRSAKLRAIKKN